MKSVDGRNRGTVVDFVAAMVKTRKDSLGLNVVVCENGYAPLVTYASNDELSWVDPTPIVLYQYGPKQSDIAFTSVKQEIQNRVCFTVL